MRDYLQLADDYAADVLEGRIPACKWVRLSCQRFRDNQRNAGSDAFPFELSAEAATKACRFIELLPHVKGRWAHNKELLVMSGWQVFATVNMFGWLHRETGKRRFRKASIYVPRKNGKSLWAAAMALYMLAADGESGPEVFSGASTEAQAWEVFRPAREMAHRTPNLRAAFGVDVNAKTLSLSNDIGMFAPVIGKPGDGASPHCWICDEYHEHQTSDQYDTAITGMGAREQPLMLVISTAGDDTGGPCYDDVKTIRAILEGSVVDEEHFGVEYTIDDTDLWSDPAALAKANPNMGVSVEPGFLAARQREAVQNARHQYRFQIKHLNVWVSSRSAYFNAEAWRENGDPSLAMVDFRHRPCFVGLDLASKVDVAAMQIVFPPDDESGIWHSFSQLYLPEDRAADAGGERYQAWAADGHLILTDGGRIDLQEIQDTVARLATDYHIQGVAYDPWQSAQLAANLEEAGLLMVEYRQTVQMMSEPMKELDALIRTGNLRHEANPVMDWMIGNVVGKHDAKDNVYPRKDREQDKIDGPVALMMAVGMALREKGQEINVYDRREVRWLD